MNTRISLAVAAAASLLVAPAVQAELVLPRISPKASVAQSIGITDLTVSYSRPGVKGRAIWGELVPWDQPWRAGANEPTKFTTSDEIQVGGQKLGAGSYALVAIPTQSAWTIAFSTQTDLMGTSNYDPAKDALRVTATPASGEHVEWLQYSFDDVTPNSANLTLRWEKTRVSVPITVDVNGITLTKARNEVAAAKPDDWRTPLRAAQFTFDNGVAMDEGQAWLDKSIAIQSGYANMNLKARWLAKSGDTKGAVAAAKKALAHNKTATPPADTAALEASLAEWTGKKTKK
jgi:hypothetical protein